MAKAKKITTYEAACKALNREPLTLEDFSPKLPEGKRQYLLSLERVTTFAEALNEGWTPDWNNSKQAKYYPYFNMEGEFSLGSVFVNYQHSYVSSRLCFRTSELAEYAVKTLFEDYRIVMKG